MTTVKKKMQEKKIFGKSLKLKDALYHLWKCYSTRRGADFIYTG
jgi:hypothetical protein